MAEILDLPLMVVGLPEEPPAELGPALDAASRCFARHGITRTSMTDIAREARVSRSTIYRQLGSTEQAARLLLAREVHELFKDRLTTAIDSAQGPEIIVALLAEVVSYAIGHPVLQKVLAHEPEIIGPFLVTDLPEATGQIASLAMPILQVAMDGGLIRQQDPHVLAHWLVRLAVVLVVDPPPVPVRPFVEALLGPALDPSRGA